MIRALWFIGKLAVVVAVAIWLADRPGTLVVDWQGWVFETSVAVAFVGAAVALGVALLVHRLLRAVWNAPSAIGRSTRAHRRERGYQALTQGMVAVAAGDVVTARKMARKADSLLNEPPLTMLLSAQAAQLAGDDKAAKAYFTAMLERPETAFLGLRGLLTQALKAGDRVESLALARRAHQLQANTPWVLATLYDLEARAGEWAAAETTLQAAVQVGVVTPEDGRHHRAALLLERSFEAERRGRGDGALAHAQSAHDLLPGFVPAAARLARLLERAGRTKPAARVVERTWRLHPHPELADVYRQVLEAFDPLTRFKLFGKLCQVSSGHGESQVALARSALDARLWGEARAHLRLALDLQPAPRVYRLLADLELAERHDEEAARAWLLQAAGAPPDPAWTCRACGTVGATWAGLCGHCQSFDTLDWKTPSVAIHLVPAGSALPGLASPGLAPPGLAATGAGLPAVVASGG